MCRGVRPDEVTTVVLLSGSASTAFPKSGEAAVVLRPDADAVADFDVAFGLGAHTYGYADNLVSHCYRVRGCALAKELLAANARRVQHPRVRLVSTYEAVA